VFARDANNNFYPAGIYLGDGVGGTSRVRVIDTNVLALVNLAASSANTGTNYTGGGVIRLVDTATGGASSFQRLTVNIAPPGAAALATYSYSQPGSGIAGSNRLSGKPYTLLAPSTNIITFKPVSGYLPPTTNYTVILIPGQDATLDFTYLPLGVTPPVLSVSTSTGLRVSGTAATKVQLQFRTRLEQGVWADEPGKTFTLGASPVTVVTPAAGAAKPGFYRVVVVP